MNVTKAVQDPSAKERVPIAISCDPDQEIVAICIGAECTIGLSFEQAVLMSHSLLDAMETIQLKREQAKQQRGRVQ